MKSIKWVIVQRGNGGAVDLERGGRIVLGDVPPPTAKRYLKRHRKAGEQVWQQEPDGYRTRLA